MGMTFAISEGLLCPTYWCAFPKYSLQRWGEGCGGLICIANGLCTGSFHKWTGGPGHGSHTHPIRHTSTPYTMPLISKHLPPPPPPHTYTRLGRTSSAVLKRLNVLPGWLLDAGTHSGGFVPAVRQEEGPGRRRVRVKGRGPTASTSSMERCSPPQTTGWMFVSCKFWHTLRNINKNEIIWIITFFSSFKVFELDKCLIICLF